MVEVIFGGTVIPGGRQFSSTPCDKGGRAITGRAQVQVWASVAWATAQLSDLSQYVPYTEVTVKACQYNGGRILWVVLVGAVLR